MIGPLYGQLLMENKNPGYARYTPRPMKLADPRQQGRRSVPTGCTLLRIPPTEGLVATGDQVFANINTIVTSNQ